ncbi:hypothetical protein IPG41_04405 [Candidatus Peregrinibacteria bacterium]|nr:MAG: hypothetical protein IPG41_04405 [Candidatus Peregrinibacteria bacterium]
MNEYGPEYPTFALGSELEAHQTLVGQFRNTCRSELQALENSIDRTAFYGFLKRCESLDFEKQLASHLPAAHKITTAIKKSETQLLEGWIAWGNEGLAIPLEAYPFNPQQGLLSLVPLYFPDYFHYATGLRNPDDIPPALPLAA